MQKTLRVTVIPVLMLLLIGFSAYAGGPDPVKIKKNLIGGTWQFTHFWSPYKNDGEPAIKTSDPKFLYTAYTFYEDGRVVIWSLDTVAMKARPNTAAWGIVMQKNSKGKETPILRIADGLEPGDQKALELTNNAMQFIIVQSKSTFLAMIPIPQYKTANSHDKQSAFKKIPDMPPGA